MKEATSAILAEFEALAEARKKAIREAKDEIRIKGTTYYVANDGCDENDGRTPKTAWKTMSRVSAADLKPGDGVRFRRGYLFRGSVLTKPGVTYCAFGEGEKPKLYGWDKSLADPALRTLYDEEHHIWKYNEPILDCGPLVFNGSERHSRKLIPSYTPDGTFVCRDDASRPFFMAAEMTENLDIFCQYDARRSGYGWGQQRHNIYTPAHAKGWSYVNTARNYTIRDNIFDRSAYRMVHLVAEKQESCPVMQANHSFDENAEKTLETVFGERDAKVYFIR